MQNGVLRNWKHLRGEVTSLWTHFTADDLEHINGDRRKLVNLLEFRFGLTRNRAEREVDLLVSHFEERLLRAS